MYFRKICNKCGSQYLDRYSQHEMELTLCGECAKNLPKKRSTTFNKYAMAQQEKNLMDQGVTIIDYNNDTYRFMTAVGITCLTFYFTREEMQNGIIDKFNHVKAAMLFDGYTTYVTNFIIEDYRLCKALYQWCIFFSDRCIGKFAPDLLKQLHGHIIGLNHETHNFQKQLINDFKDQLSNFPEKIKLENIKNANTKGGHRSRFGKINKSTERMDALDDA